MKQSPSSEANNHSAAQEIPCLLWNPEVQIRVHGGKLCVTVCNMLNFYGWEILTTSLIPK